jgi:DNA adenine methylase
MIKAPLMYTPNRRHPEPDWETSDIDHERLFALTSKLKGKFMLTYDNTDEIQKLAELYHLPYKTIPMKTTHHLQKTEIIISDNFSWWK